ncbi:hypothetical protein Tco_1414844, partial [Tanacetum coccineum]
EEMLDSVERVVTTASSLEVEQASGNINKTQFTVKLNEPSFFELGSGGHTLGSSEDSMEHQIELTDNVLNTPHDSPLPGVNTLGSDEGSLKLNELMDLVTKLSYKVFDLEKVKTAQAKEITGLKRRITKKHLKAQLQFGEDAFDDLVDKGMAFVQEKDAENQGNIVSTASFFETVSTTAPRTPPITTTVFDDEDVTMAMGQTLTNMKEEKAKEKGVVIKIIEDSTRPVRSITTLQPLPTINPKDKGKGILQETEPVEKTKKKVQGDAQIERDAEVALRLQSELDEELRVERERQKQASKVAIAEMFDEVQERIDIDYEIAARMTHKEQEKYTIEERARGCMKDSKRGFKILRQLIQRNKLRSQLKEEEAAEYEKENEELRLSLKIISNDDSEMEEKDMHFYKLNKADGSSSYHEDTQAFLRSLDRQDLNDLYMLVQESYGVHTLFMDGKPMEINMLMEKKYPLIKELLEKMLNLQLEAEEESTMAFEFIKFIKSLLEE